MAEIENQENSEQQPQKEENAIEAKRWGGIPYVFKTTFREVGNKKPDLYLPTSALHQNKKIATESISSSRETETGDEIIGKNAPSSSEYIKKSRYLYTYLLQHKKLLLALGFLILFVCLISIANIEKKREPTATPPPIEQVQAELPQKDISLAKEKNLFTDFVSDISADDLIAKYKSEFGNKYPVLLAKDVSKYKQIYGEKKFREIWGYTLSAYENPILLQDNNDNLEIILNSTE